MTAALSRHAIDQLVSRSVREALASETESPDGQRRLAAWLERRGWRVHPPTTAAGCEKRKGGG